MANFQQRIRLVDDSEIQFIRQQVNRLEIELQRIHWQRQRALADSDLDMQVLVSDNQRCFEDIQALILTIQNVLSIY